MSFVKIWLKTTNLSSFFTVLTSVLIKRFAIGDLLIYYMLHVFIVLFLWRKNLQLVIVWFMFWLFCYINKILFSLFGCTVPVLDLRRLATPPPCWILFVSGFVVFLFQPLLCCVFVSGSVVSLLCNTIIFCFTFLT